MEDHKPQKYTFKIVFLGDIGTGKTSIIRRYVKNEFTFQYKATIGVDFFTRVIEMENGDAVHLQMWDVAGQDRSGPLLSMYCRQSHAVVYVFDCNRLQTLTNVPKWIGEFKKKTEERHIPSMLMANKNDIEHRFITSTVDLLVQNAFIDCGWHMCSAKDNIGIESSMLELVHKLIAGHRNEGFDIANEDVVDFSIQEEKKKKKSECCSK